MTWVTVSSWSCFCWLCRASSSLTAKNIINLIFRINYLLISMCRVVPCVAGRQFWRRCCFFFFSFFMTSLFSWKILLAFALLHFVPQGHDCLLLQVSPDFLLLHSSPLWWKGHLFKVLVLEGLIGLYRNIQLTFFHISGWGIDLDYCYY